MPKHFYKNIKPYVDKELILAKQARKQGDIGVEFTHLENAHVLGQASTLSHTKVHIPIPPQNDGFSGSLKQFGQGGYLQV